MMKVRTAIKIVMPGPALFSVMAGLDPAIHAAVQRSPNVGMDCVRSRLLPTSAM